jgi:hypothetical protein
MKPSMAVLTLYAALQFEKETTGKLWVLVWTLAWQLTSFPRSKFSSSILHLNKIFILRNWIVDCIMLKSSYTQISIISCASL